MEPMNKLLVLAMVLAAAAPVSVSAEDSLARFEGGIGVIPVSNVIGTSATGDATRNVVRGVSPGGQPWVIADLSADIKTDGRVSVDGRGLLLGEGNGIGTNGGQSVRAMLFCGPIATNSVHTSDLVALEPNGDFRIKDTLSPPVPATCDNAVLLIVSGAGRWFAAGIPKL
jgi:hypothetical protein